MASKNKDNPKGFERLLMERIAVAEITDTDLAEAVGVSKGLISQLRTGTTKPSLKIIPSLAWALRRSPSSLFDDVCLFLKEAGLANPCVTMREVAAMSKGSMWIVMPRDYDGAPAMQEALRRLLDDRGPLDIRLFATWEQAALFRSSEPDARVTLKTPSEVLLNLEYPLVFLDPESSHGTRVFRAMPDFPAVHLVEIDEFPWLSFLIKCLKDENHFLNVAELANVEKKQDPDSLVILYTNFFPEAEEELLYEAVTENLRKNVRYLYLVPTLDEVEAGEAKLTYNSLRKRLRGQDIDASDKMFKLIKVPSTTLFREGTFILYAAPTIDGEPPELVALYRQVDGTPVRFQKATRNALAQFDLTLMNPLIKIKEIAAWLGIEGGTAP